MKKNINNQDFVNETVNIDPEKFTIKKKSRSKAKIFSLLLILLSLGILTFGGFLYVRATIGSFPTRCDDGSTGCNSLDFGKLVGEGIDKLTGSNINKITLKGEERGRTNFLILGTDAAANLTDTMMIASFYHQEKKMVTLNLPRDLLARVSYEYGNGTTTETTKLNAFYSLSENYSNKEGAGVRTMLSFIESEFGIDIDYWIVTDFRGVQETVDILGGVEVNVDKAFTDYKFPDGRNGYIRPAPSFQVGTQTMNGQRALIYARSRMAAGDGGDFARSRRQSIVVQSILTKIKSNGISNISDIKNYMSVLEKYTKTNMSIAEMWELYNRFDNFNPETDFLREIWEDGNGILCAGESGTSYGYHIKYCGGGVLGTNSQSTAAKKARNTVKNLLPTVQSKELLSAKVSILGNQSNDTYTINNHLESLGFTNILVNNNYSSQISSATATSQETSFVYIVNPNLVEKFNNIRFSPGVKNQIIVGKPTKRTLPSSSKNADIVIWVESTQ